MLTELSTSPIEAWAWLAQSEAQLFQQKALKAGEIGACASFIGTMRDFNLQKHITSMKLVHYPGMTEKELEQLAQRCLSEHDILAARIIHRVGDIKPNETLVVIAVWSAHRKEAFTACRELIESLKHQVPLWKKETTLASSQWVSSNTPA